MYVDERRHFMFTNKMFSSAKIVTILYPLIIVSASAQRCICKQVCINKELSKKCIHHTDLIINNVQLSAANFEDIENDTIINLIELRLRNIKTIEANTFKYLKVKNVILEYNYISEIASDSFAGISKLTNLHLDHNVIETLQPNSIPATENLYLDYNSIEVLDGSMFVSISTISIFSITNNKIAVISSNTFKNSRMTHLYLSFNRFVNIKEEFFYGMKGILEEIELDGNYIEMIERNSIPGAKKVNLYNNSLASLSTRYFKDISSLMYVDARYNCLDEMVQKEFNSETIVESKLKRDSCTLHVANFNIDSQTMHIIYLILAIIIILLLINIFILCLIRLCARRSQNQVTNVRQFSVILMDRKNIRNGRNAKFEEDNYGYVTPVNVQEIETTYDKIG
ncbi:PREDICTED: leucine-rich repeats and immunoglobulin-like domains protein 1 [Nicrophorus vespilloides]|uniref:Leucine-rich repeats and immunoglobulin-like domains protein 1 n=1 Tax=Nicrophorus vespilloides TaxID=110193 RepID=A0ABM1N7Y0_NICVS|nr:PREDICTED: leucine-rich repeats and immunoglobulin-like domains protein 1 [Nicrophorus vespilloides]